MSFFSKDLDMACLECSTQTLFISRQHRIEYCEEHRHLMNKDTFEWKSQRFFNNRKRIEEYYKQDLIDVKNTETTNISELKINSTIFNNEIMLINLIKNIESYFDISLNKNNFKHYIYLFKICINKNIKTIPICCNIPYKLNARKDDLIKSCSCSEVNIEKQRRTSELSVQEYVKTDPLQLISKTILILPLNNTLTKYADLQLNIRKFIVKNNLTEIPKCKYCSENSSFHGNFLPTCGSKECISKSRSESRLISTKNINNTRNRVNEYINENFEIIKYADRCIRESKYVLRCKKCSSILYKNLGCGQYKTLKCSACFPSSKCSDAELEILNYVGGQSSNRTLINPLELDIVKDNFAIEYNGMYWHSDKYKDKNYHQIKTELCTSKGITLFHIFEHEWLDNTVKEIWKSILNIKMNNFIKIDINKCQIKFIDEIQSFCQNNHLEGYVESEVNIGVYDSLYSGELIQSISLTNDNDNWTITRFCTKNNVVVNGLSKLLAEFQKEFKNIKSISYISNRRYDYISLTDMNFIPVYTEPNILYIRPDLINKKSDHIIYDSGNIIWTKFL